MLLLDARGDQFGTETRGTQGVSLDTIAIFATLDDGGGTRRGTAAQRSRPRTSSRNRSCATADTETGILTITATARTGRASRAGRECLRPIADGLPRRPEAERVSSDRSKCWSEQLEALAGRQRTRRIDDPCSASRARSRVSRSSSRLRSACPCWTRNRPRGSMTARAHRSFLQRDPSRDRARCSGSSVGSRSRSFSNGSIGGSPPGGSRRRCSRTRSSRRSRRPGGRAVWPSWTVRPRAAPTRSASWPPRPLHALEQARAVQVGGQRPRSPIPGAPPCSRSRARSARRARA